MSTSSIIFKFRPAQDNPGSDAAHAQPLVMDQDYFMDLSPVIFQVENCLFRVPRYHLVKGSETFAKMFESQQTEGSLEGSSTDNPIVLPVSRVDFHNFLKLVYPHAVLRPEDISKREWLSVLKLSTLWYFRDLRQMALSQLGDFRYLSTLEKIEVGRECYIPDCLLSGYLDFVTRPKFITDEEATAMGSLTAIRLCRIRETFMIDDDQNAEALRKAQDNIELDEFRKEFVSLQERARGYMPSGFKMVDRRLDSNPSIGSSSWGIDIRLEGLSIDTGY